MDQKKFVAYWDESFTESGPHEKELEFFSEDNGYTKEEIEQIESLDLAETWISNDYGYSHIVMRVN